MPTNMDTNTINYNEHITVSNNPLRRTSWEVTKIVNDEPLGVTKITLAQQTAYDPRDNLSWVNTTTDELSDVDLGNAYDFFQPRTNDQGQHTPADEFIADDSIISFSGVKPGLKCGGSYKTYTANFYQNNEFVDYKPYWNISYFANDQFVCEVNFIYDGNTLAPDNSGGEFIISSDRKITYKQDGAEIFGIQYSYDASKPNNLKLRSLSILGMIGNKIVITADNEPKTLSASIEVEVQGL